MVPFTFQNAGNLAEAARQIDHNSSMAIAGGTTMLDLMKLNVLAPTRVVHVRDCLPKDVRVDGDRLVVGAAVTMADLADHPAVLQNAPAVRHSLILAASPQIRNMATIGGNLLQRTRSAYFRHVDFPQNAMPEMPGGADTSLMAVLGSGGRLVGMYPGDFAVTLVAFDGQVVLRRCEGQTRTVPAQDFYNVPAAGEFQYSVDVRPGELITHVEIPLGPTLANSFYMKVRERSSYAFALASCSVGMTIDDDQITAANVGLGGLGSIPWHSPEAEDALIGQSATDATFEKAAQAALAEADPPPGLEYKVPLARRTIVRAMQVLRDEGPPTDERLWAMQHGRG